MRALRPVTRSGGSVLKAPQRRRGGTPPRAEPGAYRYPKPCIPCILGHERPRVARPRSCGGNRLREAGAPSSRRLCQSLLGRRRGGTPPRAETGAYRHPKPCIPMHPQARKTPRSETTKQRRRSRGAGAPSSRRPAPQRGHSPASGNRRVPPSLPMHPQTQKPRVFSPHGEEDTGS